MNLLQLECSDAEAGMRLDKTIVALHGELSRARVQQLIAGGYCQLDGVTVTSAALKVKCAQRIQLELPEAIEHETAKPQNIPLDIIFEDDHLLVVNKPVGLTVHPAPGHPDRTLVNALLHHCGESLSGIGGVMRPGIVHRLDKDTSGLMVVAKHDAAHQHLSEQLKGRSLKRTYAACVWGVPQSPNGCVDAPIGRSRANRQKMAVMQTGGKEARTHYELIERFRCYQPKLRAQTDLFSLVYCHLDTGRTHQIRVHMSYLGHPIMGDEVYGASFKRKIGPFATILPRETVNFLENISHQALFALKLTLIHPDSGEEMQFESPLPDWLKRMVECGQSLPKAA